MSVPKIVFAFLIFLSVPNVRSQFKLVYNDSIPVDNGQRVYLHPWAGGLSYPQFSEIDFDFDGDMDLFIFDRSSNNILLFETIVENGVKKHKFVPNAARFFPADLKYRAALIDYNGDGKNDIFTYGIGGVKVYKNVGDASNGLQWQLASNLLYSQYVGSFTNLYISSSDIPAYVDVDGDGDIDILTFHIGGERVEYHQNQSMELYGNADSLRFELKNECWGKFTEDPNNNLLILNSTVSPCDFPNIPNPLRPAEEINLIDPVTGHERKRHAGSTLLAIDIDHSGVMDLIIGDVAHNNLILLKNGGSVPNSNSAMVSQEENFPVNSTPASLAVFPASYFVDVNHDGIKDLIVAPNAKNVSENEHGILYYKNTGSNNLPVFEFQTHAFLQNEMIEAGTASIPVFYDQNNDGLEDLVVSSFFRYDPVVERICKLSLYQNSGTASTPAFSLAENDYLQLTARQLGLRIVPAFGDIDGDGDKDMFLGLENGTLAFFQNIAGAGNPANFANPVLNYTDNNGNIISTAGYCFPQLFDLNKDGLMDLILGKLTGELIYYQNVGTATAPLFLQITDMLGGIDLATTSPEGYAAPHFFRWNDTTYLFLGGFDGKLHFYKDIENNLQTGDQFELISNAYLGIDLGAYSSFWVNDIDQDGKINVFAGGDLGGIMHFEHDPNAILATAPIGNITEISIYPNPSSGIFHLSLSEGDIQDWQTHVYDNSGRAIAFTTQKQQLTLLNVHPGLYHLQMQNKVNGKIMSKKIVIKY